MTKEGTADLGDLFERKAFPYPKPVELIKHLVQIGTINKDTATILDFFAGSGTTGQAVLKYNAEHTNSKRRFILCTNNENNICREVTYHKKAEPMRKKELISGNYAITDWIIGKNLLDDLLDLPDEEKVVSRKSVCDYQIRVAYQIPIKVTHLGAEAEALARTFEDSLIYTNWDVLSSLNATDPGQLLKKLKDGFDAKESFDSLKTTIFNELKKSDVKAEFALDLIFSIAPEKIAVPEYINKGLTWLESVLCAEVN